LHLARLDVRALDLLVRPEALVRLGAGLDVLHLDLHECAAASADVHVIGFQHAPHALVPFEQVADPDLGREYFRHGQLPGLVRKTRDSTGNAGRSDPAPRIDSTPPVFDSAALISGLPHQPGVYRMLNAKGDVLYVGKAGDLHKRVSTYFQ
jgi:hypothetical protein